MSFAYNSSKLANIQITDDQTESIYNTNSFISKAGVLIRIDDLIEVKNHIKLFDYMLDHIQNTLTKDMIFSMYKILKRETSAEDILTFNPSIALDELLDCYNNLKEVTIKDIIVFYSRFERIHPLSNGNGQMVELLCLKNV